MSIFDELRGNLRLTVSFLTAAVFLLTVAGLLIVWRDDIALLAAIVGGAMGWAAGVLLAPYKVERERFQRISKGVAGFLSGYVVAKVDRVFDLLLEKTGGPPAVLNLRLQRTFWISLACFVVVAVTVFVARSYGAVAEDDGSE